MRIKTDANERAFINQRIADFEAADSGCSDPGCTCDGAMATAEQACLYAFDLRLKFEFDPQGLTNKQKGIVQWLTNDPLA